MTQAEAAKQHVFYPWSKQADLHPLEVVRASGCTLELADGREMFDFSSQLICVNAGHGQKAILDGIRAQLEKLTYVAPSFATGPKLELSKAVARRTPGDLNKIFFTNGGADAIENAVKMARRLTGRRKVLTRYRSYHGGTYGALSLSGDPRHHASGHGIDGVVHVLDPYCYRCPFKLEYPGCGLHCAEHVLQVAAYEGPENIAAILMEPITGTNGVIIPPADYYKSIREFCDQHGILLIIDEVMTGFGRTGKWFAIEHFDVQPDLLVMAKGLTSAYAPLGAVAVRDHLADRLDELVLDNGLTYSGHALACAAGVATLKFYEEHGIIERTAALEPYWLAKLEAMRERHPCVGDARGRGLFGVLELVAERESRRELVPWNSKGDALAPQKKIAAKLVEAGLFTLLRWSFLFLAPPLIVTEQQLDTAFDKLDGVLDFADSLLPH